MKCLWNLICKHPIWSMTFTWIIIFYIMLIIGNPVSAKGSFFLTLFIYALIAPFIRKKRKDERRKKEADYQAKQIALELDKLQNPHKYEK